MSFNHHVVKHGGHEEVRRTQRNPVFYGYSNSLK